MAEITEKVVVIDASTGGTEALKIVLESLPADAPGIVIVQHKPEQFTRAFANRLNGLCNITVKEAETNDTVIRGGALFRCGERRATSLPSSSVGRCAIPLRGALRRAQRSGRHLDRHGDDGARGMLELKQAGAMMIAQDEASCVVFGMPKEAIKLNCVDKILALQSVAGAILHHAR